MVQCRQEYLLDSEPERLPGGQLERIGSSFLQEAGQQVKREREREMGIPHG